jgi:rhodanese-related sulfurtransferase
LTLGQRNPTQSGTDDSIGGTHRRTTPGKEPDMPCRRTAKTVDDLLIQARAMLPHRPTPAEAFHAQENGSLLVDIRGDDQRRAGGLIPGAIVLPRNSLEWRCDPASLWRHPAIISREVHLILVCQEGYQSSLAAATLQQLGLANATDLDGGFAAWAASGLPVIAASGRPQPGASDLGLYLAPEPGPASG